VELRRLGRVPEPSFDAAQNGPYIYRYRRNARSQRVVTQDDQPIPKHRVVPFDRTVLRAEPAGLTCNDLLRHWRRVPRSLWEIRYGYHRAYTKPGMRLSVRVTRQGELTRIRAACNVGRVSDFQDLVAIVPAAEWHIIRLECTVDLETNLSADDVAKAFYHPHVGEVRTIEGMTVYNKRRGAQIKIYDKGRELGLPAVPGSNLVRVERTVVLGRRKRWSLRDLIEDRIEAVRLAMRGARLVDLWSCDGRSTLIKLALSVGLVLALRSRAEAGQLSPYKRRQFLAMAPVLVDLQAGYEVLHGDHIGALKAAVADVGTEDWPGSLVARPPP
jgi:hypothetical protein